MKNKYSKEELLHSLPDYIRNKIEDEALIDEIENELRSDPFFKAEKDELNSVINSMESLELRSPPESYFINLPVRINQRIERERQPASLWVRIGLLWKLIVPAITIIIIAVFLLGRHDNADTQVEKISGNSETIKPGKDAESKINDPLESEKRENPAGLKNDVKVTSGDKLANTNKPANNHRTSVHNLEPADLSGENNDNADSREFETSPYLSEFTDELIQDETDEDILSSVESNDESIENEFLELTPEQQQEVLKSIKESNI